MNYAPLFAAAVLLGSCRMRSRPLIAALSLFCAWPALAAQKIFDFADDQENQPPKGFRSTLSGTGKAGDWQIRYDDAPTPFDPISPKATSINKRKVLAQLSQDKTDEHFPLLIYEEEPFGDFVLTTQFKMVDGAA